MLSVCIYLCKIILEMQQLRIFETSQFSYNSEGYDALMCLQTFKLLFTVLIWWRQKVKHYNGKWPRESCRVTNDKSDTYVNIFGMESSKISLCNYNNSSHVLNIELNLKYWVTVFWRSSICASRCRTALGVDFHLSFMYALLNWFFLPPLKSSSCVNEFKQMYLMYFIHFIGVGKKWFMYILQLWI